jgi:PAS domain-containing protein
MVSNELLTEKTRESIYQLRMDLENSQRELEELKEKYQSVTDQSLMGMAIIQDGKLKYVNSTMSNINGFSINEMLNWESKEFIKFIHPDDISLVY